MKLLDIFGGAGGAGEGYRRAGFDIECVDLAALAGKRYPGVFHHGDWRIAERLIATGRFDAIHASPPCQAYSITKHSHDKDHPELLEPVRDFLISTGLPYVIENVVGAPLINPLLLCGTMFALEATDHDGERLYLKRHRLFESNAPLMSPGPCRCADNARHGLRCGGVYGGGTSARGTSPEALAAAKHHAGRVRRGGYTPPGDVRRALMGIDWMTQDQLSQAIPPAYTEHIGAQLLDHLNRERAA